MPSCDAKSALTFQPPFSRLDVLLSHNGGHWQPEVGIKLMAARQYAAHGLPESASPEPLDPA